MNTGMTTSFLQQIGVALLEIFVTSTTTTISFIFSVISSLISAALLQSGLGTGGLLGS